MAAENPHSIPQIKLKSDINLGMPNVGSNASNREHITFVQFSDRLLTPNSVMRDYYRNAYSKMEGYYFPEHYMEIPYWIPTISGTLPNDRYDKALHIVTDLDESIDTLSTTNPTTDNETVLFSVMDANVKQVNAIASAISKDIVLGGYTDPTEFSPYTNVRYLNGVDGLSQVFEMQLGAPPDYSLFEGEKCIPRLSLSTGCLFRCNFCTVPTVLTTSAPGEIQEQVEALKPLDFKLIFLDDKSLGQAKNWRSLRQVREQVEGYNQEFLGFIGQTPPTLALKGEFLAEATDMGLKYLEIGVETVNDEYLKEFNKPYRVKHLEKLCEEARRYGLKLIPNLIMGIPGDDYRSTITWIERNKDIIPVVNINFLAVHYGNERGTLNLPSNTVADRDQNSEQKSWLEQDDLKKMRDAMEAIYQMTSGTL